MEDAAEGILLAAEHYNRSESVNLGAGFEISIQGAGGSDRETNRIYREARLGQSQARWTTKEDAGYVESQKGIRIYTGNGL